MWEVAGLPYQASDTPNPNLPLDGGAQGAAADIVQLRFYRRQGVRLPVGFMPIDQFYSAD